MNYFASFSDYAFLEQIFNKLLGGCIMFLHILYGLNDFSYQTITQEVNEPVYSRCDSSV